jgi:TatD DNase family protein
MDTDLFDTHAHIQFPDYGLDPEETWAEAQTTGVTRMMLVGCKLEDSRGASEFANRFNNIWASVGIHPHEANEFLALQDGKEAFSALLKGSKVKAIGECGLDFYYNHSTKENQVQLLEFQLEMAQKHNLPVIFHIRDAFQDFWPIFDRYNIKKGLIHSFTGVESDIGPILDRNLLVGLNGIMTFTKQEAQLEAAKLLPLSSIVLETDAPYLTPKPFRGKICKPEHVKLTAAFLAELRNEPFEQLAFQTTRNAQQLFGVE